MKHLTVLEAVLAAALADIRRPRGQGGGVQKALRHWDAAAKPTAWDSWSGCGGPDGSGGAPRREYRKCVAASAPVTPTVVRRCHPDGSGSVTPVAKNTGNVAWAGSPEQYVIPVDAECRVEVQWRRALIKVA